MIYHYQIIPVQQNSAEIGSYVSYAIAAFDENCNEIVRLDDFCTDYAHASAFAEKITLHQLDPIHLYDAAYDWLIETYSL